MKTKKKWLARVIFFIAVVFCVVILAACNDDSCSHSWGKWTVTTNATCTEAGVQERKCLKCGEKETSAVEALGHDWSNATCLDSKTCKTCSATEGSALGHTPNADDGDCTTDILCSICGTVTTPGNATHTGGEATCTEKAKCEVCGTEYGDLAEHTPEADDGDCTTDILCSSCGAVTTPGNVTHTGGEATCVNKAHCEICGTEYGNLAEHTPEADDGDCTTDILCSSCGTVTTPGNATHTGGEATCTEKAKCEVCGTEYGDLAAHIPEADDGDCTTDVLCSSCGAVTTPGNATHTGGEATCVNKAICEICGTEYGELAAHIPEADDGDCTTDILCSVCGTVTTIGNEEHENDFVWMKHLDSHYLVYSCCSVRASDPEEHTIVDGACTECGFKPTITLSSVEVAPGETQISIAVSITDNPGITGMMITVQYSSEFLTLIGAENGEALDALTFTEPGNLNSGCTFLWDALEIQDKDIKNGEILILTFDVSSSAPEGTYSVLLNVNAYDNDLRPLSLTITGGNIWVENN